MAKVKPDGSLSGIMDDGVFRSYNGQTFLCSRPDSVHNPRTLSQQTNRLKLRNIINMYGSMNGALKDNFQGKTGRQSDYTRFQGCNLLQTAVYVTYDDRFACVVAPYVVSFGTLPSIGYHLEGEWLVTDIDVAGLELNADTKLSKLSECLLKTSGRFSLGDRIELIACRQTNAMNLPRATCKYCEFVLDDKNYISLSQILNGFELRVNEENKLCFRREEACGLALVHKRGEGCETFASVQSLAVDNPLLERYTSEEQKQLSIASYAKKKK